MIHFKPGDEAGNALFDRHSWLEIEAAVAVGDVGVGFGDLARLHGEEFFEGFAVEGLLEELDEVEEVDGAVVAEVEELAGRAEVEGRCRSCYDVVDVGEVALHLAVIEEADGLLPANLLGETVVGHVGPPPRAVSGKIAESGDGEAEEVVVGVGHRLVGFFRRAVKVDGVVGLVVDAERDLFIEAVDGRGGGVDELDVGERTAGFEERDESLQVGIDVVVGMGQGMAHSWLGGQVGDMGDRMVLEELFEERAVAHVAREDLDVFSAEKFAARFFEPRIVIAVEMVDPEDKVASRMQKTGEVESDEASGAGD